MSEIGYSGFTGTVELQKRLQFKPSCFRCRSWYWNWYETQKSYCLTCENCGLTVTIRKKSLVHYTGQKLPLPNVFQ
ncbi:MAG: hypothetical protein ACFE9L_11685 [Candidatus Hodarchaeota archaeon]